MAPKIAPSEITRLSFAVRDGEAAPEDARRLMEYFCECVEDNRPVPPRLLAHFAEAFRAILTGYRFTGGEPRAEDQFAPVASEAAGVCREPVKPKDDPRNWRKVTVAAALGFVPRKGRRQQVDDQTRMQMAGDVLRLRLQHMQHQEALAETATKWGWAESVVSEAWAAHRLEAIALVRLDRDPKCTAPWTPEEQERLRDIFEEGQVAATRVGLL